MASAAQPSIGWNVPASSPHPQHNSRGLLAALLCGVGVVLILSAGTAAAAVPQAAEDAFRQGQDLASKDDHAKAIAAFKEAVRLAPTFRDAHLYLAMELDVAGDHEAANGVYDTATKAFPKDAELWAEWGTTLILLKRFDKAAMVLDKAVALAPKELGWQADLAYATSRMGNTERAILLYEKAFTAGLTDPIARRQYGDALAKHGALPKAEQIYSELLDHKPRDRDLLYRRAKVRRARGNAAGAAADEAALRASEPTRP